MIKPRQIWWIRGVGEVQSIFGGLCCIRVLESIIVERKFTTFQPFLPLRNDMMIKRRQIWWIGRKGCTNECMCCIRATLLLIAYFSYKESSTPLDLSKKDFILLACQDSTPSITSLLKENLRLFKLRFSWGRQDLGLDLVNKGGARAILTLNHEFFGWHQGVCGQGHCPSKAEHL